MRLPYKMLLSYHKLFTSLSPIFVLKKSKIDKGKLAYHLFKLYIIPLKPAIHDRNFARDRNALSAKGRQGFTLVELIVTVSILAIITAIATPSILTQLTRMEAKRVKSQLENTLSLAKAESYISRQDILVCLSKNERRCHRNGDKTLLAFVDNNDNQRFDAQTDTLLTKQILNLKYSTVKLRVGGRRHYTKFWGDSGKPRGHFGHIKYCPTSSYNQSMYQISFNQAGIVRQKLNSDHPTDC